MNGIHPAPGRFTDEEIAADPILHFFHYAHLPAALQSASEPFCGLAAHIVTTLPRNAERSVALRKLLEAKDAAVRANVGAPVQSDVGTVEGTFATRLLTERAELLARLEKLAPFLGTDQFRSLPPGQRSMLEVQHVAMCQYLDVLTRRCQDLSLLVPEPDAEFNEDGKTDPKEIGGHDIDRDGPPSFYGNGS